MSAQAKDAVIAFGGTRGPSCVIDVPTTRIQKKEGWREIMSDLEKELKPCPFCYANQYGDDGVRLSIAETSEGYFAVVCLCGSSGPIMDSKERAVEAWDTRGPSDRHLPQYPFDCSKDMNPVDFKGSLKSLGLSTILQILSSENRTGVLHFSQGQTIRAICLKDGKIIAASGRKGQRLGQILYARGLISQEQLQEALKKARETGKRLGEVLLNLSYINEHSLKELIRYQIREAVLDISLWVEGDFEYRDCPIEFDERGVEDVNTMRIILEAAVIRDESAVA